MYERSPVWWETHSLYQSDRSRDRHGPLFCAVIEIDGVPEAYAAYHVKPDWADDATPQGRVEVEEAIGTTPEATREIWRFVFGVDLVTRVQAWYLPADHPLFLMVKEPRRLRMSHNEILWLRIVDVKAALEARSYATDGTLVFEVEDEFCSWNSGRYELDAGAGTVVSSDKDPELRMKIAALAAPYLGGFTFARMARSGKVEELNPGALQRADAMFVTDRAPWCPENF
jgi:predicted acetyltransferase